MGRGDATLFIINTLLQAKYKDLNDIDTPITLSPSQLSVATDTPPERTVVGTMLAAGHVAMSLFDVSTAMTLKSLKEEMARVIPIAGMFSPSVCEQLFINTPLPEPRSSPPARATGGSSARTVNFHIKNCQTENL